MTEQERFDRCLTVVLRLEGGYADDPRDPGGPTNLGITQAALSRARGAPASARAVRDLTPDEAGRIYRADYWAPAACGELPAGLDLMTFDAAVNMGPGTAARLLQAALGLAADGAVGPRTVAAARAAEAGPAICACAALRAERYRRLAGFPRFGRGWLSRVDQVRGQALAWARATAEGTAA